MRPHILTPLFADLTDLQGIGPRLQKLLKRLLAPHARQGGAKIVDLLFHFPVSLVDRRARPKIAQAIPGQIVTMKVEVAEHRPPPRGQRRIPYRVVCSDDTGSLELVFFHANAGYLEKQLPVGETRIVSGRVEEYGGRLQMPHPDHILRKSELETLPLLEPVYPLTAGLSGKVARKAADQAVARLPELPEWQDAAWLAQQHWPSFRDAVRSAHAPQSDDDLLPVSPAHQRLAFDELLANQLALALVRRRLRKTTGRELQGDGALRATILDNLPFKLTPSQSFVMGEIEADMAAPTRMLRLLQGDVGSGKTVVALLTMHFHRQTAASLDCNPVGSRTARGVPIVQMLPIPRDEKITSVIAVAEFTDEDYLVMLTQNGYIKKTALSAFSNIRTNGLIAISLEEGDQLRWVRLARATDSILIGSRKGMTIHFKADHDQLRPLGRPTRGVRAMSLKNGDSLISMDILPCQVLESVAHAPETETDDDTVDLDLESSVAPGPWVLVITAGGLGKRVPFSNFRLQNRAGMGLVAIKFRKEDDELIALRVVAAEDELMLVTNRGIIIRQVVRAISIQSRMATGVQLQRLDTEDAIAAVALVPPAAEEDSSAEASDTAEGTDTAEAGDGVEETSVEAADVGDVQANAAEADDGVEDTSLEAADVGDVQANMAEAGDEVEDTSLAAADAGDAEANVGETDDVGDAEADTGETDDIGDDVN